MTTRKILLVALLASALGLAGCGGEGETDGGATQTIETTVAPPPPVPPPPPTPTAPTTPRRIPIVVVDGRPRGGIARPKIEQGERIVLVIRADAGEGVHVHGYDVERTLEPGRTLRIPITASIPGRFEVELHDPDVLLAVLEVRP